MKKAADKFGFLNNKVVFSELPIEFQVERIAAVIRLSNGYFANKQVQKGMWKSLGKKKYKKYVDLIKSICNEKVENDKSDDCEDLFDDYEENDVEIYKLFKSNFDEFQLVSEMVDND